MTQPNKEDKPCKEHFLLMPDESECFSSVCEKCGWKIADGGWHLRPVKLDNRWYFDH
jgi:hypothetical protein